MSNVKIVTDSSAILSDEEVETYNVTVIPMSLTIDGTLYQDGVTIGRNEFLDKMKVAKELPTTSQPPIGEFTKVYENLVADGASVISVHMSGGLSGTVNAAKQAAELVDGDITVVDSTFIDRAEAFQVLTAAELAQQGATVPEILEQVVLTREKSVSHIFVAEMDNLVKGGRISKTAGAVASLLNIHAGLHLADGGFAIDVKARGAKAIKKYMHKIIDDMQALPVGMRRIDVSHAGVPEKANELTEALQTAFPDVTVHTFETSPNSATHAGAGALAIAYETK
ncbi:DegV family protein [Weissella viridescens]|uniref:DegV family protein n=1 Tax=Weissella viridescens TaxID=1629 RepID=A0A3P2RFF3_WEIVI|nr:DegV family protein [Weissella viridescens]RRG18205.1 DegV family protein [Weissella viridescens]